MNQWERICLQGRKCEFNPRVRKIPWRRKWQPTPVFLPWKSHGQKEPGRIQSSPVQSNCSVMSDSFQPHGLQHTRPPYPSAIPEAYSNSCPSSWRCHPTISSSVIPFFSHLQSFPISGSFQMSQFFASGAQIIRVLASTSVLPMNTQD